MCTITKKEMFSTFLDDMRIHYPRANKDYFEGAGHEFEEKKGKYGMQPPKMAIVASSSRFCYLALRDGAGALGGTGEVKFGYSCKISDDIHGTPPQLAAFVKNEQIFIEVKCHEIFDSHKIELRKSYWNYIYGEHNEFGLSTDYECTGETFDVPLNTFGITKGSIGFDTKQFLCHLLGVAAYKGDSQRKKLVYCSLSRNLGKNRKKSTMCLINRKKE